MEEPVREESGAALVETAFVLVLLMMLLVGTITAAVALGSDNSIQNAAREASRFAATLPGPVDPGWFDDVRTVAQAAALGDLDPSVPGRSICVAIGNGTTWESATYTTSNTTPTPPFNSSSCYADGRGPDEGRVQVVVQRDISIEAVVLSFDITLSREAVARYER